ncbi:unnamed protein product [Sympodiomycopsis kandeliae]
MADANKPSGSNTAATTSANTNQQQQASTKDLPLLGALDEDDEFEEFEVQDWDESDTIAAAVSKQQPSLTMAGGSTGSASGSNNGSGNSASDHLWEDNWDDDDTEDEWSKRLREHLAA